MKTHFEGEQSPEEAVEAHLDSLLACCVITRNTADGDKKVPSDGKKVTIAQVRILLI